MSGTPETPTAQEQPAGEQPAEQPLDAPAPEPGVEEAVSADQAPSDTPPADPTEPAGPADASAAPAPVPEPEQAERDYLDDLRRLQADFENYKKRMVRQQTDLLERAAEQLVLKLLPVLDTIDLARSHGAGDDVEQVAAALVGVLEKEGLERIDPVGEAFDPNQHEAVQHEPGDGDAVVSALMRAGYRWKGRVVRPAMVTVKG